jgi:hypothetical protein
MSIQTEIKPPADSLQGMVSPLPCPFCGAPPIVGPGCVEREGNAWGYVACQNPDCPAQPIVQDGEKVADERGIEAYRQAAITRWNVRANAGDKV